MSSLSADAVSENSLRETAPMILARWKTATYKGGSEPRKPARGDEKGGGPDEFGNRRRLHTPEAKQETGLNERANLGSGCRQRVDLKRAPGYWETSEKRRMRRGIPLDPGGWLWRQ